jgi:DNA polymerase III sliding clamp (beta) subunit (PCNA family)
LPIEYAGKELVIGFNPVYFLDMLKNWAAEDLLLEFFDAEKPGVVRSPEYVYIVQPMRLS